MLDSKYLRQDIEQAAARLATRGFELDIAAVTALEEKRKTLQVKRKNFRASVMQVPKLSAKQKRKASTKKHNSCLIQSVTLVIN